MGRGFRENAGAWAIGLAAAIGSIGFFALAAAVVFLPPDFMEPWIGGRRGLPRRLLESEGGILAARVILGLCFGFLATMFARFARSMLR